MILLLLIHHHHLLFIAHSDADCFFVQVECRRKGLDYRAAPYAVFQHQEILSVNQLVCFVLFLLTTFALLIETTHLPSMTPSISTSLNLAITGQRTRRASARSAGRYSQKATNQSSSSTTINTRRLPQQGRGQEWQAAARSLWYIRLVIIACDAMCFPEPSTSRVSYRPYRDMSRQLMACLRACKDIAVVEVARSACIH